MDFQMIYRRRKIGCVNTIFVYHEKGGRFDMKCCLYTKNTAKKKFITFIKEHLLCSLRDINFTM